MTSDDGSNAGKLFERLASIRIESSRHPDVANAVDSVATAVELLLDMQIQVQYGAEIRPGSFTVGARDDGIGQFLQVRSALSDTFVKQCGAIASTIELELVHSTADSGELSDSTLTSLVDLMAVTEDEIVRLRKLATGVEPRDLSRDTEISLAKLQQHLQTVRGDINSVRSSRTSADMARFAAERALSAADAAAESAGVSAEATLSALRVWVGTAGSDAGR